MHTFLTHVIVCVLILHNIFMSTSCPVSDLLGIDGRELQEALTTSGMVARGETIIRYNSVAEASNVRDALSKAMYNRLFSWLVNKINQLLKPVKGKSGE